MGAQFGKEGYSKEVAALATAAAVIAGTSAVYYLYNNVARESTPALDFSVSDDPQSFDRSTAPKKVKALSAVVPLDETAVRSSKVVVPALASSGAKQAAGASPRFRVTADRKELGKHGFVDKYRVDGKRNEPQEFEWVVINRSPNKLEFTLDFTGSDNFDFKGMEYNSVVDAYAEQSVAHIKQADLSKPWSLKLKQKLTVRPMDSAALEELTRKQKAENEVQMARLKAAGITSQSPIQDITIAGLNFIDDEFPPVEESLWDVRALKESPFKGVYITWRRPRDFLQGEVAVFDKGISPMDIAQGRLGNCWFLCAVACLAEFERYIFDIFDDATEATNKAGVYRMKLCVGGEFQDITVDDFIPCYPGQGPVFSQNRGPELWAMLLEKAYAKVHGSYYSLASGNPSRALQDLTGFPVEYYWFEDEETKATIASGEFRKKLLTLGKSEQLTAAGTSGEDRYTSLGLDPSSGPGLVAGHAYTVLHVQEDCGVTLLKLRNPWGRFEWKGDYGDESPKWTPELIAKFKPTFAPDDGEFWMCYEDFLKHFCSLNVGYCRSPTGRDWSCKRRKCTFSLQSSTEAVCDSYVELRVQQPTYAFIAVHQMDTRIKKASAYADQGLFVCKRNATGALDIYSHAHLDADRDAQVGVMLEAGTYVVMPYTSGANMSKNAQRSKDVNLSIHADRPEVVDSFSIIPASYQEFLDVLVKHLGANGKEQKLAKGMSIYTMWDGDIFWIVGRRTPEFKAAPLELTVDTSNSKNAHSSSGSLKAGRVFKAPGATVVFHALCSVDSEQGMTASMSAASKYISA